MSAPAAIKTIFVFLTWDVSLNLWQEKGLLAREVKYYERLAEQGFQIILLSWGDQRDTTIAQNFYGNIKNIPAYKHIPTPKNKALRAIISLFILWATRRELASCDLIKTNQMWGGWYAALAKYIFRKPLLVRTGFELYKFTIEQKHGYLRQNFIRFISSFTYKAANIIYAATHSDKNFIIKTFNIKPDKINVRPNWIDSNIFKPIDCEKKENTLLYVGRLTKQKNLPLLLQAVKEANATLDIVGDGELKEQLTSIINKENIHVNFLGSIPNNELPQIYNQYHIFVLPSYYEGNPKTLLEAMACGSAVIGTDSDGIRDIITHEKTGLLCRSRTQDLTQAITNLLSNPNLRATLGNAARNQIKQNQDIKNLVLKETNDYNDLIRKKG